jgi:uncharacterized protein (TIGR03000 family)
MRRQRLLTAGAAGVLSALALAGTCRAGDLEPGAASGFTAGSPYSYRPLMPGWSYYARPAPVPRYERYNSPIFMTSINYPGVNGAYTDATTWTAYYDRSPYFNADAAPPGYLTAVAANTTARIDVRVPASDAQLNFDNHPTSPSGLTREFVTPPLIIGSNYVYNVRVSWMDNGVRRTRDKNVFVRAGDRLLVDLSSSRGTFEEPTLRTLPQPEASSELRTRPLP